MEIVLGFTLGCAAILALRAYNAIKHSKECCIKAENKEKSKKNTHVNDDYDDDMEVFDDKVNFLLKTYVDYYNSTMNKKNNVETEKEDCKTHNKI